MLAALLVALAVPAAAQVPPPAGLPPKPAWKAADGIAPAALAAALRLLEAMDARRQFHAAAEARLAEGRTHIVAQMGERVPELKALRQRDPDAYRQRQAQIAAQLSQAGTEMMRAVEPELMREMATLYLRRFTVAEMDALADFYRSPLGVKFRTEMPGLTKASAAVAQRIMLKHFPAVLERMTRDLGAEPVAAPRGRVAGSSTFR